MKPPASSIEKGMNAVLDALQVETGSRYVIVSRPNDPKPVLNARAARRTINEHRLDRREKEAA